ncbi:MAG: SCO family protein [Bacteroidetes bacterium]|nr:SCO family protein [Bacteroidota bacterium]
MKPLHDKGKSLFILSTITILTMVITGCSGTSKSLPKIYTFAGLHTSFVNQDSERVVFPSDFKGKLVMMSFIYTHCPYVCPMTTRNLHELQDSLSMQGIKGVKFVSLTYDPNRDTPPVLKRYAEERGIKFDDWDFLTGTKTDIDSVLNRVKIKYTMVDSSHTKTGKLVYFIRHPDECVLIDGQGRVRGVYTGSHMDFADIINDIKALQ